MLDNVLESKVRNKILIFMILFNNNVIHLDKILLYLNISEVYLKDLVNELNHSLNGIATIEFQKDKQIKIMLNENVCYLEILHIIYQESFILKYFDFIINDHENQPFSVFIEQYYHSVANAYRIKNKAEKFLNQIGLATTKNQLTGPEYRIRFFIAILHSQYGIRYKAISDEDIQIAHEFILSSNHAIRPELLTTTTDDFLFFEILLILTWKRRDKPTNLSQWADLPKLKKLFIYQRLLVYVHENLEKYLDSKFSQEELDYLFLCYCTTNNYLFSDQWSNEDIKALHQVVFTNENIKSLLTYIHHQLSLGKEIIFTRNFRVTMVYFYKKMILNLQSLFPESNPFIFNTLSPIQKILFKQVKQMIEDWQVEKNIPFPFTNEQIFYLANQIESTYQLFVPEINIVIVTNTISEFESISLKLTTSFNRYKLNPSIFLINDEDINQLYQKDNCTILLHPKFSSFVDENQIHPTSHLVRLALDFLPTQNEQLINLFKYYNQQSLLKLLN